MHGARIFIGVGSKPNTFCNNYDTPEEFELPINLLYAEYYSQTLMCYTTNLKDYTPEYWELDVFQANAADVGFN